MRRYAGMFAFIILWRALHLALLALLGILHVDLIRPVRQRNIKRGMQEGALAVGSGYDYPEAAARSSVSYPPDTLPCTPRVRNPR